MFQSVYSRHFNAGLINSARNFIETLDDKAQKAWPIDGKEQVALTSFEVGQIIAEFNRFEPVLESELQSVGAYIVTRKGGFRVSSMVEEGSVFFQSSLAMKVPDAIDDIRAAMRCIAFELPTAAGFHLHRANESVLRAYWKSVTGGKAPPKNRNMGGYLVALERENAGKQSTRDQLKSLKNFHRNPLMHPDQSLENTEDAIDLMAAIRCSIGYMLQEI